MTFLRVAHALQMLGLALGAHIMRLDVKRTKLGASDDVSAGFGGAARALLEAAGAPTMRMTNLYNVQYIMWAGIGSPPQEFQVQLDTGSSDFWVPSQAVATAWNRDREPPQFFHRGFDQDESSTFTTNGGAAVVRYGDGSNEIDLLIGNDQVWFGAELSAAFTVGIATSEEPGRGTPWQMYKYDGIMGVAFPGISQTLGAAGAGGSPTAPFAVARKKGLPEVLTVVLSRVSDPQATTDDDQWNPSPGNVPAPGTRTGSVAVVGGGDLRALVAERWPYWPLPPGNKSTHPFPVPRDPRVTGDDDDTTAAAEGERESWEEELTQLPAPLPERLLHRAMESARGKGGSSGAGLAPSREGLASLGLISEDDAAPSASDGTLRGPSSGGTHRRLPPSLPYVSQPVLPNQTDASWVRIKPTSEVGYGYWQADVAHAWVTSGVTSEEGAQPDTSADRCGGGKRQVEPSCTGIFDTGTSLLLLPGALLTDLQDEVQAAVKKAGFEPCPTVYGRLECPEDALVAAVQDLPALWITVPARRGPGASGYGAGTGLVDIGVHGIDLFNCDIQGVPPRCQFMVTGGSNVIDDHTLLLGDTFLRAYGQVYAYGNASMGLMPAVPWAKTRPSWYEPLPVVPWYKLWYVWVAVVLGIAALTGFAACCYLQAVKKGGDGWDGDGGGGYEMGMGEEGDTYAALQGDDDGVTFGGGINNGGPVYAGGSGGGGGFGGPVDAAEQGGYLMPGQNSVMVDGQQVRVT